MNTKPPVVNVNLEEMETERCRKCGCPYFEQLTIIKKIPGVIAASPTPVFSPVTFWACCKCKTPHESTMIQVPGKMAKWDPPPQPEPSKAD